VDTTAISIYHLIYELGLNQEVQQTLYDEIVSVVKKDDDITEDHIEKLKYLKMVFKESGRFVNRIVLFVKVN
jgi:cytochrome P450